VLAPSGCLSTAGSISSSCVARGPAVCPPAAAACPSLMAGRLWSNAVAALVLLPSASATVKVTCTEPRATVSATVTEVASLEEAYGWLLLW
jgi:hypothetical protein